MTLKDLSKVYHGDVRLTINAYFDNGEYYSFRSYNDHKKTALSIVDDNTLECEILSIIPDNDYLWIDVKETI